MTQHTTPTNENINQFIGSMFGLTDEDGSINVVITIMDTNSEFALYTTEVWFIKENTRHEGAATYEDAVRMANSTRVIRIR